MALDALCPPLRASSVKIHINRPNIAICKDKKISKFLRYLRERNVEVSKLRKPEGYAFTVASSSLSRLKKI